MCRTFLTLLLGLMLMASGSANALSLNCERTVENHDSFSTIQAFDSWFPKTIRPTKADQIPTSKDTQVRFQIKGAIYDLTPSKWMLGRLPEKGGYKSVTGVRYRCSLSSHEVKLALQKNSESSVGSTQSATAGNVNRFPQLADLGLCNFATRQGRWEKQIAYLPYVQEAKHRRLTCGVGESSSTQVASTATSSLPACPSNQDAYRHNCFGTLTLANSDKYVGEFRGGKANGKGTYSFANGNEYVGEFEDSQPNGQGTYTFADGSKYVGEVRDNKYNGQGIFTFADGRTVQEGVWKDNKFQYAKKLIPSTSTTVGETASAAPKPSVSSAELTAAQLQAKAERQKRLEAEAELAALKAQKEQQQATIEADNQVPLIDIFSVSTTGKQGLIKGYVADNTGIAEVAVDGRVVPLTNSGSFEYRTFVPPNGISVQVQATDLAGLTSVMSVSLERSASTATASITFDRLNPLGKRVKPNRDALALIVGVADYENTPAKAIFADSDALMFRDYASEKLGIPENRIQTLVDDGAGERELLLAVKSWITRSVKQRKSDIYIFFAGHGLASDDGNQMYLLPYDGAPELLEETTISRQKLFNEVAAANPRSVTVFLDTCYSGQTRNERVLIASRPIGIKALKQSVPDNFTVMTAAAGDQTAKPLEEAKHGMFSYFLMKGMEGDADANKDNRITAGELHAYVKQNVIQQSSGSQTPELQGDADRVLVRFQ